MSPQVLFFNNTTVEDAKPILDLTFEDLRFDGGISPTEGRQRDGRVYPGGIWGIERAISLNGSRIPGLKLPVVSNITIRNCTFYGTPHLPVMLAGVTGSARIADCHVERCKDCVFTFCESVIFSRNRVAFSADHGVSPERGNEHVVVSDNVITDPFYWGISVGGFRSSPSRPSVTLPTGTGSQTITVSGNVIKNAGSGGIDAGRGPQRVTIVGNTVHGATLGADGNAVELGIGVLVQGMDTRDPDTEQTDHNTTPTDLARDITISGNTLTDCERGGILIWSAANVAVTTNTILRPGLSTGATSPPGETGFGIASPGSATHREKVKNVYCADNFIVDDREPEKRGLQHATYHPGVENWTDRNNQVIGARIAYSEPAQNRIGTRTANERELSLSGSNSSIPGCSATLTLPTNGTLVVTADIDYGVKAGADAVEITVLVGSTALPRRIYVAPPTGRYSTSRTWSIALERGEHEVDLRARLYGTDESASIYGPQTALTWTFIPGSQTT